MASIVDICNTALAHLGDDATVASIDPPEGSAQAEHCRRFYPMALRNTLEHGTWAFATKRAVLAPLALPPNVNQWLYAYAPPVDLLTPLGVLDVNAANDYNSIPNPWPARYAGPAIPPYTPQPFTVETLDSGTRVLYTNQQNAMLRYVSLVDDSSKFSGLFVDAVSRLLASYLAGPVIKGLEGRKVAQQLLGEYKVALAAALDQDGDQTESNPEHIASWMVLRG